MKNSMHPLMSYIAMGAMQAFSAIPAARAQTNLMQPDLAPKEPSYEVSDPQDPKAALDFWTDAQMKDAEHGKNQTPSPAPGGVITPGGEPTGYAKVSTPYDVQPFSRITGMLFFLNAVTPTFGQHCSASVIKSASKNLVLTAAHCVANPENFHGMMMFVPAYDGHAPEGKRTPLGKWPVERAFIPYKGASSSLNDDVAIARVYDDPAASAGFRSVEDAVGGGFTPMESEDGYFPMAKTLGYPGDLLSDAGDPYNGEGRQFFCDTVTEPTNAGGDDDEQFYTPNCNTTDGNSGGPLMLAGLFDQDGNQAPTGTVIGVMSKFIYQTRLKTSNFGVIYRAADTDSLPPALPH